MNFTFINLTTALPVDCELKEYFESKMSKEFRCALGQPNRFTDPFLKHTPIFFVGNGDADFKNNLPITEVGTDSLGIYRGADKTHRQSLIKICPEKIYDNTQDIINKIKESNQPDKTIDYAIDFEFVFRCVISAVILHEIAHLIMDHSEVGFSKYPRVPLDWALRQQSPMNPFKVCDNAIDEEFRKWEEMLQNEESKKRLQKQREFSATIASELSSIEESLANALMLKNLWVKKEKCILKAFVDMQPSQYKLSLKWIGNLDQTIQTAKSFAACKLRSRFIKPKDSCSNLEPLQEEIQSFRNELENKKDEHDFSQFLYQGQT